MPQPIKVVPSREGVIRLVAYPRTALKDLKVTKKELDGLQLTLTVEGKADGLPNKTECALVLASKRGGGKDVETKLSSTLEVTGWAAGAKDLACKLVVVVNAVEAGLVGKASFVLRIQPGFPKATEAVVRDSFDQLPCSVTVGLPAVRPTTIGTPVPLKPVVGEALKDAWLMLSVREIDEGPREFEYEPDAKIEDLSIDIVWTGGLQEKEAGRTWRVGCSAEDDGMQFEYVEPNEVGNYELTFALSVSFDEGENYATVPTTWPVLEVLRPTLTEFRVVSRRIPVTPADPMDPDPVPDSGPPRRQVFVRIEVDNLADDLETPVLVTLWCYDDDLISPVGEPRMLSLKGGVLQEMIADSAEPDRDAKDLEGPLFAVMTFPHSVTGGGAAMSDVLDYRSGVFQPFGDSDFPHDHPKESGTSVCSREFIKELKERQAAASGFQFRRTPQFGHIRVRVVGEELLLGCRLYGSKDEWDALDPTLKSSHKKEDAGKEVSNAKADDDKRWMEGKLAMSTSLGGKTLFVTAASKDANADLKPRQSDPYECKPEILTISPRVIVEDGKKVARIACWTHYFPTKVGKVDYSLKIELAEDFADASEPVPLDWAEIEYELPSESKGNGLCNADGILVGRVRDSNVIERFEKGCVRIRAYRAKGSGKAFGQLVLPKDGLYESYGASRPRKGTVIWAEKAEEAKRGFRAKLLAVADDPELLIDADQLMAAIAFFSGETFKANEKKWGSGIGLLGFTETGIKPFKAELDNKTIDELKAMDELTQLDYVRKYLVAWKKAKTGRTITTMEDVYKSRADVAPNNTKKKALKDLLAKGEQYRA